MDMRIVNGIIRIGRRDISGIIVTMKITLGTVKISSNLLSTRSLDRRRSTIILKDTKLPLLAWQAMAGAWLFDLHSIRHVRPLSVLLFQTRIYQKRFFSQKKIYSRYRDSQPFPRESDCQFDRHSDQFVRH